ncbi:hypothetical protein AB0M32_17175 [Streptomyces sp. NPDC051985]|uniref:hypothetical protein n=1 Tax=Streptomyces sp. NPDC051985 TaxID=3155807 RepID=UPI003412660D
MPDRTGNTALARARHFADTAPAGFRRPLHVWIDVLCGAGSRPGRPLAPTTVVSYLRAVTREDLEEALRPHHGERAKGLATALCSLFRALKREKLIFRDPARRVSLTTARILPKTLPEDRLRGTLQQLAAHRDRLSFLLAAVHALGTHDQRRLLLNDLDFSRATLLVRREGRPDHTLYLDELTFHHATVWLQERHRRWPATTNPYLLVTAHTAVDDRHPQVSTNAIGKPLRRVGHQAGWLRTDRILDEARHTGDPVHLIRLFGLDPRTAMRYVRAAHPGRFRSSPLQP